MKYLIVIDSDGTLRKSDGTITQKTKETIKKVIEKGSTIVICTGRPRYHTLKIAKEIGASQYLISSNGTEIFDSSNNKILYASYLPEAICNSIFKDINNKDELHQYLKEKLELPEYYGNNLDALHDCLSERKELMSICIRNYSNLKKSLGEYAEILFQVLQDTEEIFCEDDIEDEINRKKCEA